MNVHDYIQPELLVLVPVLYIIGAAVKRSSVKNKYIPLILGAISVLLCGIYVFANGSCCDLRSVLSALFTAVTQGVLCAGASVYFDQIVKQSKKKE
jgi:hypothetical protein